MNPVSNSQTPHQNSRTECEQLTEQAFVEGFTTLSTDEHQRLRHLWAQFPDVQHEFDQMNSTVQRVKNAYSPQTERGEAAWTSLENRINSCVQEAGTRSVLAQQNSTIASKLTLIRTLRQNAWSVARIAAVFVLGLLVGRLTLGFFPSNNNSENSNKLVSAPNGGFQTIAYRTASGNEAEMQAYLKDAHLLMLGVMAMNAECGVSNPRTLSSQRERCVELLSRSQQVQANLSASERLRVAHLMSQIESALADFADVQPASCNASTIRQLQQRTDYALCEVSSALNEHEARKQ
jgi:hypothetical protein